ncbi:hypothetical protein ACR6C2_06585 [Streptomyces sp. INA 01156]
MGPRRGTALLAAGRYWDVLSVPDRLGLLALDLLWSDPLKVPGPTLVDVMARRVGFSCRPTRPASGSGSACGTSAVAPGWRCPAVPPTGRLEWLVPPDGTGTLHCPTTLEQALRTATGTLAVLTPPGPEPTEPGGW